MVLPYCLARLHAIHDRQPHIEQEEREPLIGNRPDRLDAVGSPAGLVASVIQRLNYHVHDFTVVIDHKAFTSREAFDDAMDAALRERHVEFVALAGFMRILSAPFVRAWKGRLVNLHPSLLPQFPGAHAIRDAFHAGVSKTGVTVHFVDEGVDSGPIIGQAAVPVLDDDSPASLHARIQESERRLYPAAVAALARGQVRIEGRRVPGMPGLEPLAVPPNP